MQAVRLADQLGASRDGITTGEDLQFYLTAFGAVDADAAHLLLVATDAAQVVAPMQLSFLPGLRFYERLGFVALHEGLELALLR